jgi:hypothetical protein
MRIAESLGVYLWNLFACYLLKFVFYLLAGGIVVCSSEFYSLSPFTQCITLFVCDQAAVLLFQSKQSTHFCPVI